MQKINREQKRSGEKDRRQDGARERERERGADKDIREVASAEQQKAMIP